MTYTGRCACGAVTLQIDAQPMATRQCWCRQCQTIAAGGPTNNAIFPAEGVRIDGPLGVAHWTAASGNTLSFHFCPSCGTQVYGQSSARPHLKTVRMGVIDQPHDLAPQAVIWTDDAPAWAVFDTRLDHFPGNRPPRRHRPDAMFFNFVDELRAAGISASFKEHLVLLEALDKQVIDRTPEAFYYLSRATFVKDEGLLDRFDQVFNKVFKGLLSDYGQRPVDVPEEWLKAVAEKFLTPEEMAAIKAMGSWEEIMETLKKRLEEQQQRHQGGNKWIGTGGTSPYGNGGYNPEGVRIGGEGKHGRAIKVWEKREFQNLDNTRELGTRNIKVALRRLRRFAREGAADELDLNATIEGTARQGWLDIRMRPERHNAVKLLLFLDVGGSMDPFIKLVEELFSAATTEFKNLEFFYFHNCLYEGVWKDNRRRWAERTGTWDILHKYGHDYKVIFVGDAAMSPYEITHPGGSVEHFNEEAGAVWMHRVAQTYPATVWLNPVPEKQWAYSQSTKMIRDLVGGSMHPLTLAGLDAAMRELTRKKG